MTALRFAAPIFPGGRHCLLCGSVTVGAVFPPVGSETKWRWRLFPFGANPSREGHAKSEAMAKAETRAAFKDLLKSASLEVKP